MSTSSSSRPNSGARGGGATSHRRTDVVPTAAGSTGGAGSHNRNSSTGSVNITANRSDSGQSLDMTTSGGGGGGGNSQPYQRKHGGGSGGVGHHRSKSGVNEHHRERTESGSSQLSARLEYRSNQCINSDGPGSHPVAARPTSLYPLKNCGGSGCGEGGTFAISDSLQPEREPLRFDVNLVGAPPEVEQLVDNIKQVAEQFLYRWKTFPIILPTSIARSDPFPPTNGTIEGSLGRGKCKHHLRDLFVAPSFDELDAVAVDSKGETRKLTGKQLEYIRERGEFEVESLNFPGQQHKWKLSELLQKGTERSRNSLLNDLALALRFLFITAKSRLVSHFFSVSEAIKAFLIGFLRILDIIVGIPSLQAHNLDAKIREERSKYLVAELVCRPEHEDSLEILCAFVRKQLRRAATEKFEVGRVCAQQPSPVSVPYRYGTPAGADLDLRLWDRAMMRRALPVLVAILERETRGWFLHFRERLIAELRAEKMADEDIERVVNDAVMKEYLQRVYNSILSNSDLQNLGDGISELLVQQAQSVVLMYRAVENVQYRLSKSQESFKTRLCSSHPVLSRIRPWLRAKLAAAELKFSIENSWSAHEEALTLCNNQKLNQTVYFLNRDLAFMKEREPALLRELRKVKTPTRCFFWPTQIWMPINWIVKRNFQGQSEIVSTVLSKQATSITTPRSDPSQPVFLVEKEIVRTTTTRWPLWRIFNYFHRTWCWTWNAMFLFGILIPWCSPVGLRALFCLEPFMPDLELSQVNGTLFPRKTSLTATLTSRLISLWRHISKSRTYFETKPDTGFIGKGLTRHMNRIWNYFFKGLFGTIGLVFVFPLVCVAVILFCFLVAFTAVLWMPVLTFVVQLINGLVYDLDSPELQRNRYFVLLEAVVWNIGVQGCVQPLVAIFVAGLLCPATALIILTGGVSRYWIRLLWDSAVFHLLIKRRGRIPAGDSCAVRRIAGPGLAADYYFQISPEQALAAFEAQMERDELAAYQTAVETAILQPQRDFAHFVEACFGSFSTQLALKGGGGGGPYRVLEKEAQDLLAALHEKLERRRRDLQTGLSVSVKSKIKLSTNELKGAHMLERFYPAHIYPKLGCTEDQFWDARALTVGDWAALASLLYTELFSLDILTPLDHTDTSFRLDAHPQADLTRYTEMVHRAQLGGGAAAPDLLGNVYTPRGNIQVHAPYLEVAAFNPRVSAGKKLTCGGGGGGLKGGSEGMVDGRGKKVEKRTESSSAMGSTIINGKQSSRTGHSGGAAYWRRPWKQHCRRAYSADKLVIPLPVPHPAHIAITIYNRDTDDPIPLEADICQMILRGIEESHVSPDDSGIDRCQTALEGFETNSSSSETGETTTPNTVGGGQVTSSTDDLHDDVTPVGVGGGEATHTTTHQQQHNMDGGGGGGGGSNAGSGVYHWTLNSWSGGQRSLGAGVGGGGGRVKASSGVRVVDLASPEDVTLDSDSTRVMFSTYGTTV